MAQRTVINSLAGATLSISATLPATYDAAGYGATTITWTAVGEIENFGSTPAQKTITEFMPVDTAIVTKVGGSKNYGTRSLVVGYIPGNAGQALIKTAFEATNTKYSVKITYPDTSVHYLEVLVAKYELQDGTANDVLKLNVDLAICRAPVIVAQV